MDSKLRPSIGIHSERKRSNNTVTGGHRNVFFMERGWEVNPSDHWYIGRGLKAKETRPDKTLYPWMKKHGNALTAAHTPAYAAKQMSGTWTFHDPQPERDVRHEGTSATVSWRRLLLLMRGIRG